MSHTSNAKINYLIMGIGILAIASAVLLSIISAYFSVSGITTIFSAAAISVGIMGGILELSKIAATVWLYNFWKKAAILMKFYFIVAIVILISISSIGIYGYLAKAYVGQSVATNQVETRIERYQQYIDREEKTITRAEDQLELLDRAIEQYIELNVVTRGLESREEQEEERAQLTDTIEQAEEKIAEYESTILDLQDEKNRLEVNVGPIRYIAAVFYGEDEAQQYYDDAVRILILLFVLVFDPFAVLLMVAGNMAMQKKKRSRRAKKTRTIKPQPEPPKPVEPTQAPAKKKEVAPTPEPESSDEEPPLNETPPKLTPKKVKRTRKKT